MNPSAKSELSIVIPVYNEQDNLAPLVDELDECLGRLGKRCEVICVNDGSTDGSLQVLLEMQKTRPFLKVISHRVNSGESAGEATGFRSAEGDVVITMDADQQNDPADIPVLWEAMKRDVDCVCGVRKQRMDDWVKRMSSRIANRFRDWVVGDHVSDAGCTFRAIRRSALREIVVFNGMHRFLPTILRAQGYRVVEIEVHHRERTRGMSKYGIGNRLWRGIVDCLAVRWYVKRAIRGDRIAER